MGENSRNKYSRGSSFTEWYVLKEQPCQVGHVQLLPAVSAEIQYGEAWVFAMLCPLSVLTVITVETKMKDTELFSGCLFK